jgi:hypothetical protein
MEYWKKVRVEYWNDGRMEYWKNIFSNFPVSHCSYEEVLTLKGL